MRPGPQRNSEILRILPAQAFTNPHRKEMYHVLTGMNLARRPVDELTVDWELGGRGVPLDARQSYGAVRDDQTYAMHLARLDCGYQEPIIAAAELAADYRQAWADHPAGSAGLRAAGGRRRARDAVTARPARLRGVLHCDWSGLHRKPDLPNAARNRRGEA